jgi:hypothetical protein
MMQFSNMRCISCYLEPPRMIKKPQRFTPGDVRHNGR